MDSRFAFKVWIQSLDARFGFKVRHIQEFNRITVEKLRGLHFKSIYLLHNGSGSFSLAMWMVRILLGFTSFALSTNVSLVFHTKGFVILGG